MFLPFITYNYYLLYIALDKNCVNNKNGKNANNKNGYFQRVSEKKCTFKKKFKSPSEYT